MTPVRPLLAVLPLLLFPLAAAGGPLPDDPRTLRHTLTIPQLEAVLDEADRAPHVTVTVEGQSAGGRPIRLVHLDRSGGRAPFRVLFYAQQHGNEVSGKDALLWLVRDLAAHPERLPEDVDLWVIPQLNPDGAAAGRRANDAGVDLNRDHLLLSQPETRLLHRVARRVRPHLACDAHEFTRDGKDYAERGWMQLPLIMMDAGNHPLLPPELVALGLERVEAAAPRPHAYSRYFVGGAPPAERRPSTLEADDARNSLALRGALSFIIEAGVKRDAPDPEADLGERVDAYLALFRHLLGDAPTRDRIRAAVEKARRKPLPEWIPTNAFWANVGVRVSQVPVLDVKSPGTVRGIRSANVLTDAVVKQTVPTPEAYAIPAEHAAAFRPLLEAHGIRFTEIGGEPPFKVQRCRLVRLETEYDEVYNRYEGRQVVRCDAPETMDLPVGTLWVRADQADPITLPVLEPQVLYGLYQWPAFRALVGADGTLPVLKVLGATPSRE